MATEQGEAADGAEDAAGHEDLGADQHQPGDQQDEEELQRSSWLSCRIRRCGVLASSVDHYTVSVRFRNDNRRALVDERAARDDVQAPVAEQPDAGGRSGGGGDARAARPGRRSSRTAV